MSFTRKGGQKNEVTHKEEKGFSKKTGAERREGGRGREGEGGGGRGREEEGRGREGEGSEKEEVKKRDG